jgi:hypothetical protein
VLVGPNPELSTALAAHPETDGQNHLQSIEGHRMLFAVGGSCKEILYN